MKKSGKKSGTDKRKTSRAQLRQGQKRAEKAKVQGGFGKALEVVLAQGKEGVRGGCNYFCV